jgi:molybdate transport system regulatory protein
MKLSARNIWAGQVANIQTGAVNSIVEVALKGGDKIVSVITNNSVERLGLKAGSEVLAIVKSSSIMIGIDIPSAQLSARNILAGTVANVLEGAVNDEVTIQLAGGSTVTSIITRASVQRLGLASGVKAQAVIKASSVMLAVA